MGDALALTSQSLDLLTPPFEFNLQSGMERWLHYLQPFTLEEFKKITGPEGPYELAEEYRTPEVLRIVGGIPREIRNLKEFLEEERGLCDLVWSFPQSVIGPPF
jgi:hypothetical protein